MGIIFSFGFGLTRHIPYIIYFLWWVVVFISLFKTEIGLLFLIPILPFQNLIDKLRLFPLGKDLVDILLIAILVGWFFRAQIRKEKFIEKTSLNVPVFILIIVTYIGLWMGSAYLGSEMPIYTSDPRVMTWKNYMIIFLIYFMVVNNIKEKKWMVILVILMSISLLVINRWFFTTYKGVKAFHFSYKQRLSLSYLGPNVLSAFLSRCLFIMLSFFYFDKVKIRKFFFLFIVLCSFYTVLYSFTRSAYLGTLIGLIVFALIKDKRLLIPIIILLIFWSTILPTSVVERISMTITEEGSLEPSAGGRVNVWENSMELFKNNPLLGAGFQVIAFSGWSLRSAHSMYVTFLAEMGIIGISLFLLLFYIALRNAWKLYKTSNDNFFKGLGLGVFISIIVCMVTNFFGDHWTYIQIGGFYWTFLAMTARANIIEEKRISIK